MRYTHSSAFLSTAAALAHSPRQSPCLRGLYVVNPSSRRRFPLIHRPPSIGAFEFVVLSSLRASQLMRGCIPKTEGVHKKIVIAQLEVAEGKVEREAAPPIVAAPIVLS